MPLDVRLTIGQDAFTEIHRLDLDERIDELPIATLELRSPDPSLDFASWMGRAASLGLDSEAFERTRTGIVRRARQLTAEAAGLSRYEVEVVPPHWLLTQRRTSRIFQHLTSVGVVERVLSEYAGLPRPDARLHRTLAEREYVVQYDETDHEFVMRLLADDGLSSFFEWDPQGARWVIVDDTTVGSCAHRVPFLPASAGLAGSKTERVQAVAVEASITPNAVVLRDHVPEHPSLVPQAESHAPAGDVGRIEQYRFRVGDFEADAEGKALATRVLEAHAARAVTLRAEPTFHLGAGERFAIEGHPRADVSGDLLVLESRLSATWSEPRADVRRELVCVSAARPQRPRLRRKPRIAGTQTAHVVCAKGKEIDVDALGRVEIELRWDRRDAHVGGICRRVRVSQGWAGPGYGLVAHPRRGDEVVVAFLDGDPDEPIVVGRVFNGTALPPVGPLDAPTVSVWRSRTSPGGGGHNEVLMDDRADHELLALHAHRDFKTTTGRDSETTVRGSQKVYVAKGQGSKIEGGQKVDVVGDAAYRASGTFSIEGTNVHTSASGAHRQKAANFLSDAKTHVFRSGLFSVRSDIVLSGLSTIVAEVGGATLTILPGMLRLSVGGSSIQLDAGGITLIGPVIKLNP